MVPTQKNLLITEWIEALKTVITYSTRWKKKDIIWEVRAKSCKNSENWEIVETFLKFLLEMNEDSPTRPQEVLFDSDEDKGDKIHDHRSGKGAVTDTSD